VTARGDRSVQGRISDFSPVADRYDATRALPEDKLLACYGRLIQAKVLPGSGRILDAGCGTGQASLPLAAIGFEVFGIDVSAEMTALACSNIRPGWQASYIVGDVRRIDAEHHSFDAAVVSKLFQHVEDWRQACRELIRVVRPGGCIVQVNERGAFGNAVRRYFTQQAEALGHRSRYAGLDPHAAGDADLESFMRSQGCAVLNVDVSDLRWDLSVRYGDALDHIADKLFAEFWSLPETVYQDLLASTGQWMDAQPEGAGTVQRLYPFLDVKIFQVPSGA